MQLQAPCACRTDASTDFSDCSAGLVYTPENPPLPESFLNDFLATPPAARNPSAAMLRRFSPRGALFRVSVDVRLLVGSRLRDGDYTLPGLISEDRNTEEAMQHARVGSVSGKNDDLALIILLQ